MPPDPLPEPPTIILIWCPECGRDDRHRALRAQSPHNDKQGRRCLGKPIRVQYEPICQQPLRGKFLIETIIGKNIQIDYD